MNKVSIALAVIAVIIAGVALTTTPGEKVVQRVVERVGASAGPEHTQHQIFNNNYTRGGRVISSTTEETSETITAGQIVTTTGNVTTLLRIQPLNGNATVSLPASSSLSYAIPNAGDCLSFKYENSATAGTTTTIGAGAGMDLQEPDGQNVIIGQNNYANIELCRASDGSEIIATVDETIPAD